MLPIHTRGPEVRSVSPPARRRIEHTSISGQDQSDAPEVEANGLHVATARETSSSGDVTGSGDDSGDAADDSPGDIISVRAAVREYESVHDELRQTNARARALRARSASLRTSLEQFMRARKLERLGTRDGRLTVKLAQETLRVRPSKRDTMRCVIDTLGDDRVELADELIRKLYDEKKEVRTVTRIMKHGDGRGAR